MNHTVHVHHTHLQYCTAQAGEVVFASALDGWGFSLQQFARLWAKKLQAKPPQLRRMLWGEYAYSAKAKKV
jgi:ribosome assembly protein 1